MIQPHLTTQNNWNRHQASLSLQQTAINIIKSQFHYQSFSSSVTYFNFSPFRTHKSISSWTFSNFAFAFDELCRWKISFYVFSISKQFYDWKNFNFELVFLFKKLDNFVFQLFFTSNFKIWYFLKSFPKYSVFFKIRLNFPKSFFLWIFLAIIFFIPNKHRNCPQRTSFTRTKRN